MSAVIAFHCLQRYELPRIGTGLRICRPACEKTDLRTALCLSLGRRHGLFLCEELRIQHTLLVHIMHPLDSFDVVVLYGHENRLAFLVQSHIVVVSAHHGAERRKQCAQRTAHQIIVLVGRNRDLVRRIAVAVSILCGKGFQHCGQLVECLRNHSLLMYITSPHTSGLSGSFFTRL